jgi:hypothetical protein
VSLQQNYSAEEDSSEGAAAVSNSGQRARCAQDRDVTWRQDSKGSTSHFAVRRRIENDYPELKRGLRLDHFDGRTKSSTHYKACRGAGTAAAPPAAAPPHQHHNVTIHYA